MPQTWQTWGRLGEAVHLREHPLKVPHLQLAAQVATPRLTQRLQRGHAVGRCRTAARLLLQYLCTPS